MSALQDHPRGCGEHIVVVYWRALVEGSSPRMRGALTSNFGKQIPDGIIPADAGSTRLSYFLSYISKDHPRGCGEHLTDNLKGDVEQGSSPRMRGAHDPVVLATGLLGIIPADAGSTRRPESRRKN